MADERLTLPGHGEARRQIALMSFSMPRWVPFFPAMGMPESVTSDVGRLAARARSYIKTQPRPWEDFLQGLILDYGEEAVTEWDKWLTELVIDDETTEALDIWRKALTALCRPSPDQLQAPLDHSIADQVCASVSLDNREELRREVRRRVRMALSEPETAWEQEMDRAVRLAAGSEIEPVLGVVDLASDLVEVVLANHDNVDSWRRACAAVGERCQDLIAWVREQARLMAVPEGMVDHLAAINSGG